nr:RHS domain-containing protein [Proteus mirabilis]
MLCIKIREQVNCIEISLKSYYYEEHGNYTPLAVIVKQSSGFHYYWHHCDINSAPLEVTNAQGNTIWSGKYERFGFVRSSPLSFYSSPERVMASFEQNLRYAGQYFDNDKFVGNKFEQRLRWPVGRVSG